MITNNLSYAWYRWLGGTATFICFENMNDILKSFYILGVYNIGICQCIAYLTLYTNACLTMNEIIKKNI